ncbi:MAG: DciA family protein [Bifidobacteriaceae bacterium]|jgi:predicted nucleic acid-binding Zn ribbon protein|nr:DciA family protein [Bifidobacteriaceae bacterium]
MRDDAPVGQGQAPGQRPAGGEEREGGQRPAAEKAALARIMRGSTKFRAGTRPAAWSDGRDPKLAGELVDELIAVEGWQTEASVGALLADWAQIVGPQVAAHCQVVGLEQGKLTVKADSSPWAAQIRLLSPQLQAAIAKRVGPELVNAVEVLGPGGAVRRRGRFKV